MKKGIELLSFIVNNDPEAALYETGILLQQQDTETLERVWIRACAYVGENFLELVAHDYVNCLRILGAMVEETDIKVKDAMLYTLRLCFVFEKISVVQDRASIIALKEQLGNVFPEKATLSAAGKLMFKQILPKENTEENEFVQRILAGLSKIWTEQDYDVSRTALEYLSRRRLSIPKPKSIMPSIMDDSDLCWTLWGAALSFFHNNKDVATTFKLFTWNYTKSCKTTRIGLLWPIASISKIGNSDVSDNWTPSETALYHRVSENFREIWKQMEPVQEEEEQVDHRISVLTSYTPRSTPQRTNMQYTNDKNIEEERKMIKLKTSHKDIRDSKISKS